MPDISGATVFDDLPESIITGEIFRRLPSKDVLRCGAVSKSWRGITYSKEFLLDHHRRQPALPLIIFSQEGAIDVFDICEVPAKRRSVLGYDTSDGGSTLQIHTSCDSLPLVSRRNGGFSIVNPTTRQWLALPRLTRAYENTTGIRCVIAREEKVAGMYPDPQGSGEYRILFRRGETTDRNASYYILTVGSSQSKKPKCIGPSVASGISMSDPPVLLNGCLHWVPCYPEDGLLVFDTARESFRWMSLPIRGGATLLLMGGMLGMWCLSKRGLKIWVLQDYERKIWSLKCEIELPMIKYVWSGRLLSHKSDMFFIYSVDSCLHQLHYDGNGKLLEEFRWDTNYYRHVTKHWVKENLIRHTFFSQMRR